VGGCVCVCVCHLPLPSVWFDARADLSLGYGSTMSKLLNKAQPQPSRDITRELAEAQRRHADAVAVVARGVAGKYQAQRQAQVFYRE
jgi:hypothetical protein